MQTQQFSNDELLAGAADLGEWCDEKTSEQKKSARKTINRARRRCYSLSANRFIDSCESQLNEKGFLTRNQLDALDELEDRGNYYSQADAYNLFDDPELEYDELEFD